MARRQIQQAIYEATCDRCGNTIEERIYTPYEVSPVQLTQYSYGLMGKTIDLCVGCTIMFHDAFMNQERK